MHNVEWMALKYDRTTTLLIFVAQVVELTSATPVTKVFCFVFLLLVLKKYIENILFHFYI